MSRTFTLLSTLSQWSFPSLPERLQSLSDLDPEKFKLPIEDELYLRLYRPRLPDVDRAHSTGFACVLGLGASWLAIVGCFAISIFIIVKPNGSCVYETSLSAASAKGATFVIHVFLALLTDNLGYIHATSLRWALFRDGRLDFNTNIRLFNSARRSYTNWWPMNIVGLLSLILCYAATSQILIKGTTRTDTPSTVTAEGFFANGIAIFALGLGLLCQAIIATSCMLADSAYIPTWSSNALTTTLAAMWEGLPHRPGRCMVSVQQSKIGHYSKATLPSAKQPSARSTRNSVLYVTMLVWILACSVFFWTLALVLCCRSTVLRAGQQFRFSNSWGAVWTSPTIPANEQTISMTLPSLNLSFATQIILGILFTSAVQAMQTISLHCIELIVNISRDESIWRQAGIRSKGAPLSSHGFISAGTSMPNVVLFSSKAALHWLLGQCLMVSFSFLPNASKSQQTSNYSFGMIYTRVFIYGCCVTALALFTTGLVVWRPGGPQPAAWGHLQTLADLIDDWGVSPEGRFWWGDKGVSKFNGVRHAGTSLRKDELGDIMMNAVYAGK